MEKRIHPRALTLKTGKIVGADTARAIDCAILNESDHGAALLVPELTPIPDLFCLVIDPDGATRACRLRWRTGNRIGVYFATPQDDRASDPTPV